MPKFELVLFLAFAWGCVRGFDLNATDEFDLIQDGGAGKNREEHFRTALIDAFHAIKSTKGGDVELNNAQSPLFEILDPKGSGDLFGPRPTLDTEDFDSFFSDADILESDDKPEPEIKQETRAESPKHIHHIPPVRKRPENRNAKNFKMPMSEFATNGMPSNFIDGAINRTGIESLLEVFDIEILARNWRNVKMTVSTKCGLEMDLYLTGLREQKLWALKMDDSSGRYSSGFFWGNSFWTGSAALCDRISIQDDTKTKNVSNQRSSVSGSAHVNEFGDGSFDKPPFSPAFFTLKVLINTTSPAITGTKTVQIGLCLPLGCSTEDSKRLIDGAHSPLMTLKAVVARCPKQHYYDFTQDNTFRVLFAFTIIVGILLIAGTAYDFYLSWDLAKRREARANEESIGRAGSSTPPQKADLEVKSSAIKDKSTNLKIDLAPIAIPTMDDGKSIYIINNAIGLNNAIESNNSEERLATESVTSEDTIKLGVWSELLLSFSVKANLAVICDQNVGSDTIPTIHGLKAFSMLWVILGHTCIVAFKYSDNTELRKIVEKEFLFQSVTNGAYAVDTYFCASGILVTFLYFRTNAKGKLQKLTNGTKGFVSGFLQFVGLLGYRFARLTAPYMFMLGVVEISMKWFYYNSVFDPPTQDHLNCPDYWWRNMLYINTLFPVEQMCMLWSWYLADDSQFYVLGAVLLIWATSHFKAAAITATLFLVSSWITTSYIAWENNHQPSMDDPLALFDKIYDKPWTRLGPYIVGMAAGWLLFKTDCNIKMTKFAVVSGWIASLSALLWLVFGMHGAELSPIAAAAYSSLSHSIWASAVAWIVVACSTGYGGYISKLLSATILYPFSRVTYCAYLVHPVVIRFLAMHLDHPIHLGKDIMTIIFFGQVIASYILSFIVSVSFEAPFVTMLKIIAPNRRKRL